jgi:hypothetical protein
MTDLAFAIISEFETVAVAELAERNRQCEFGVRDC